MDGRAASGRRILTLLGCGAGLGLVLGGVTGGLLARSLLPWGAIIGAVIGTFSGLLAAGLSLAMEALSHRWPLLARQAATGAAAVIGTTVPMLVIVSPENLVRPAAWPLWLAGLAGAPIALLLLRWNPPETSYEID